jgi:hypothetical protein
MTLDLLLIFLLFFGLPVAWFMSGFVWEWLGFNARRAKVAGKPQDTGLKAQPSAPQRPRPLKIFMSYRRSDSLDATGRIYDRLVRSYGAENVFRDIDNIPFGLDFREYLDQQLADCDVCLVVIGPRWLSVTEANGTRRLDNPRDHVRLEIETALRRNIRVVPLLVGRAELPAEHELPAPLRPLAFRNGIEIRPDPDFHRDMDRLASGLAARQPS